MAARQISFLNDRADHHHHQKDDPQRRAGKYFIQWRDVLASREQADKRHQQLAEPRAGYGNHLHNAEDDE